MFSYIDVSDVKSFYGSFNWGLDKHKEYEIAISILNSYSNFADSQAKPFYKEVSSLIAPIIYSSLTNAIYFGVVLDKQEKFENYLKNKLGTTIFSLNMERTPKKLIKRYRAYFPLKKRNYKFLTLNPNPTCFTYLKLNNILPSPLYYEEFFDFKNNEPFLTQTDFSYLKKLESFFIEALQNHVLISKSIRQHISLFLRHIIMFYVTNYRTALRSKISSNADHIYTGTQGKDITRIASLAAIINGCKVSAFPHTGGFVPVNKMFRPLIECITCTDYYCYHANHLYEIQSLLNEYWFSDHTKVHLLPNLKKESVFKTGPIKKVTYVMRTLNIDDEIHYGLLTPTVLYAHLHFKIIEALLENNLEVTIKLHRKNLNTPLLTHHRRLLENEFGNKLDFETRPLDELTFSGYKTDAWICDNVDSGTVIETLKSEKPVILFEHHEFSKDIMNTLFNQRAKLIKVYFDKNNLPTFNRYELKCFLEKPNHLFSFQGIESFVNYNFKY